MNKVKYSIIIPVYNVEKVLERCLDSILAQTITNFECILIDDGSTDSSGEICDKYKLKDNRIKVLHKKNEGVSKARNEGLKLAHGEYIVFVDSDDCVSPDYLSAFEPGEYDLIMTGAYICDGNLSIQSTRSVENKYWNVLNENDIIAILDTWNSYSVWAKCFKKSIIDEVNMSFAENCNYGEDAVFTAIYLKNSTSVKFKDVVTYWYCQYEDATLSKLDENEKLDKYNLYYKLMYDAFEEEDNVRTFLRTKYWLGTETRIEKILRNNLINDREKANIIGSYLSKDMAMQCLKNNIVDCKWKKILYKSRSNFLILCWIKVRKLLRKGD